ncbi:MAG: ribosome-binding factor A [uncultured bacterium]|nr:MAG: ribosome-binding factor A [uncultured bacterium]
MPSQRIRQINTALRDYMATAIMRNVELPPGAVVSVTKVHTTADLHHAQVFLSIVPDNLAGSTLQIIKQHIHAIVSDVVDHITFRLVPQFHFKLDDTERKATQIEALLDSLKKSS